VAEVAVFLLLPSALLCCFLPLFFVLSVNRVSSFSAVDVWPPSCSQWITVAGERHDDNCCGFFFFPVCCLCQQRPPLSVLFLLPLSGSVGVGSADGGGMAVLDGGGRRPRWRERSSGGAPGGEDGSSSSLCRDRSFCFLFLSPFSRLTSLSVTALALLLQNFAPLFFLFSTTRNTQPFFVYSRFFSPSLLSVFIGAQREGHLTFATEQGKVATLPLSWRRVGAKHGCPQGKALLVFHHGGRVCVGMGSAGFPGQVGWGERERKKTFKIFFFPASACVGKKENNAFKVFWFFFFLRK